MTFELQVEVAREYLRACEGEFAHLQEIFQILDSKAERVSTIAGISLAGLFSALELLPGSKERLSLITLGVSACILLVAMLLAAYALKARRIRHRPHSSWVRILAEDLLKDDLVTRSPSRMTGYFWDQADNWEKSIESLRNAIRKKGRSVEISQLFLSLGLVVLALHIVSAVFIWG